MPSQPSPARAIARPQRTRRLRLALLPLLASLFGASPGIAASSDYDFPIADSYVATVVGTPVRLQASLPATIPVREKTLANRQPMPDVFWYNDGLNYSVALQDKPAPLVFSIGGTGSAHNAHTMVELQKALYQAGFHVINLASPTHLNFLLSASTHHMAGYAPEDVADIYRVMQAAYAEVKEDIQVTGMHVIGYSLGGLHAAFVAQMDEQQRKLNLQKAYLINPPVDLYRSAQILDRLMDENVPRGQNGLPNITAFLDGVIDAVAENYDPARGMRFDQDALYATYREGNRQQQRRYKHSAGGLIAFSFRMTSGTMVFASDVMNRANYIVPRDKTFSRFEPLDYYARASHAVRFKEYVDELLIPSLQARLPGKTAARIIEESSLRAIEPYLASNPRLHVVHNRDDLILAPGELDYLERTLGRRITVYPAGGHMGNVLHATNMAHMIHFLQAGDQP